MNVRPVIGVVSEPISHHIEGKNTNATSYLAASYVKFLEAAGARVVPLRFDAPRDRLTSTLEGLNGVLYPGGGASLAADSPFFQGAQFIWEHAIKTNQAGKPFPVWGTCLGFELISVLGAGTSGKDYAGNHTVLQSGFDSEDYPVPLDFTPLAARSRMFSYIKVPWCRRGTVWLLSQSGL